MSYEIDSHEVIEAYKRALKAQKNAHAPYSSYQVGSCVKIGEDYFSGCNVENASYGGTVCAERTAILSSIAALGKQKYDFIVVVTNDTPAAPPCAFCLQVMSEFFQSDTPVFLANQNGIEKKYLFNDLLPVRFDFSK